MLWGSQGRQVNLSILDLIEGVVKNGFVKAAANDCRRHSAVPEVTDKQPALLRQRHIHTSPSSSSNASHFSFSFTPYI